MSAAYFPPPESRGGWRYLDAPTEVHAQTQIDVGQLDRLGELQAHLHASHPWAIVIIRHGFLVREYATFMGLATSRFDIWSGTKSFTGTAWGLLLDDSRHRRLPGENHVDLDTAAYSLLPEAQPLSDPRKANITIRHLLTMTSGIPGEGAGLYGVPTATRHGPFEHAFGHAPNRFGRSAATLAADPGTHWDYSDPAMAHLSPLFAHVSGTDMRDYMYQRVFTPIGIEEASWDVLGGSGSIGPHTNPHVGLHISARELARFGYLMLHRGRWHEEQVVPRQWVERATQSSQQLNPEYGYTWWVNTAGTRWPTLPRDTFALEGYNSNRCYVIPSLDLVVARTGAGPPRWDEQSYITGVVAATRC